MVTMTGSDPNTQGSPELLACEMQLAQAALSRLTARSHLHTLASGLFAGLVADRDSMDLRFCVGELERGTICGPQEVTHECPVQRYECKDDFDCKLVSYDCGTFRCGDNGEGAGSFNCDNDIDFMCGGEGFECYDDFDCTAGHIFMCMDWHECTDNFSCAAKGTDCDENYQYDGNDNGQNDPTSGDFVCGWKQDSNIFDCYDDFECTAEDEFDCRANTAFECGDGDGTDSFNCGKDTKFECDTEFECLTTNAFQCKGVYTPPPDPPNGG